MKGGLTLELVWLVSHWICAFSRDLQTIMIRVEKINQPHPVWAYYFDIMGLHGMKHVWNMLLYCINSAWVRLQFGEDTIIYGILQQSSFSGKFHLMNHGPSSWFLNNPGFSTCQTRWSIFGLNFSQCNAFNSLVLYHTIPRSIDLQITTKKEHRPTEVTYIHRKACTRCSDVMLV